MTAMTLQPVPSTVVTRPDVTAAARLTFVDARGPQILAALIKGLTTDRRTVHERGEPGPAPVFVPSFWAYAAPRESGALLVSTVLDAAALTADVRTWLRAQGHTVTVRPVDA